MKPVAVIQNWASESGGAILDYFEEHHIPCQVVHGYRGDAMPAVEDLSVAVVLGCPISVNRYREHDFLTRLYEFMSVAVKKEMPLLGICLGAQMLAKVLGAEVKRNHVREIGIYRVNLTEAGINDKVFEGFGSPLTVFHWHQDTFGVVRGAILLATSDTCTNQAFRYKNSVGLQFHIEPLSEDIPRWCDEYAKELAEENLTKEKIVTDFKQNAEALRLSTFRLLDNFLS
ncbi:MAG: type 1 glutamine amidotransferase [Candidatus Zixiibacteriota bacterium]